MSESERARHEPAATVVDVLERGANRLTSSRRPFMQLLVYGGCSDLKPIVSVLESRRIASVVYADVNDPRGVGVLSFSEDPTFFVTDLREALGAEPFSGLTSRPDMTMLGRAYSSGFEPDL